MKRLMLALAAMLTFGVASAQINPAQPQQTQPDPADAVAPADAKNTADKKVDVQVDATSRQETTVDGVQPRKDEIKTEDHVKSTPDPSTVQDKEKTPVKKNRKKKRT